MNTPFDPTGRARRCRLRRRPSRPEGITRRRPAAGWWQRRREGASTGHRRCMGTSARSVRPSSPLTPRRGQSCLVAAALTGRQGFFPLPSGGGPRQREKRTRPRRSDAAGRGMVGESFRSPRRPSEDVRNHLVFPSETANRGGGIRTGEVSAGETAIVGGGGAESGALPADLARVIERWPTLTRHQRRRIVALVEAARDRAAGRRR